jgi:hypothetical protein
VFQHLRLPPIWNIHVFFLVVTRTIPVLQIGLPISDEWFPHAGCERVQAQQNIKEEKVITMILESCCIRELKAGSCRYLLRFLYLLIPQNLLRYCKPSCDPYILKGAPHSEQEHLGDPLGQNRMQSVWSSGLLLPLDLLAKVPCILHFIAVAKCYIHWSAMMQRYSTRHWSAWYPFSHMTSLCGPFPPRQKSCSICLFLGDCEIQWLACVPIGRWIFQQACYLSRSQHLLHVYI